MFKCLLRIKKGKNGFYLVNKPNEIISETIRTSSKSGWPCISFNGRGQRGKITNQSRLYLPPRKLPSLMTLLGAALGWC